MAWTGAGTALALGLQVTPVAEIKVDSDGRPLRFPTALSLDRATNEVYLITGGRAQVIAYGTDLFPLGAIGPGRGIEAPQGGFVGQNGLIYICQSPTKDRRGRITVLDGAYFVLREVFLDKIPDVPDFSPRDLVVSRNGTMYVASWDTPGVAVLEEDGTFLRWLRPLDRIGLGGGGQRGSRSADAESAEAEGSSPPSADKKERPSNIPDALLPKPKTGTEGPQKSLVPVYIRSVSMDKAGNIYLTSSQTSKTYVYSPEETLLFSFGEKGGTPGKLSQPRGLAIDEDRKLIYVVDYMRHTVLVYNNTGKYLFEFGGKGDDLGWFRFPTDVLVNKRGQVIVADLFNHRLQVFEVSDK